MMSDPFYLDDPLIARIQDILNPVDMHDDSHVPKREGQKQASTLMPLIKRNDWQVLLTRRPMHMPTHKGQISFPGGRVEAGETPSQGALRETREEVGVAANDIHLLGRLHSFNATSQFRITPFVGVINPQAEIIPDPGEVDEVTEIPLSFFLDRTNHVSRIVEFNGVSHELFDMPWPDPDAPTWHVWGMTAMMMYRLGQGLETSELLPW